MHNLFGSSRGSRSHRRLQRAQALYQRAVSRAFATPHPNTEAREADEDARIKSSVFLCSLEHFEVDEGDASAEMFDDEHGGERPTAERDPFLVRCWYSKLCHCFCRMLAVLIVAALITAAGIFGPTLIQDIRQRQQQAQQQRSSTKNDQDLRPSTGVAGDVNASRVHVEQEKPQSDERDSPLWTTPRTVFYVVHYGYATPTDCDSIEWADLHLTCGQQSPESSSIVVHRVPSRIRLDQQVLREVNCRTTKNTAVCTPTTSTIFHWETKLVVACTGVPADDGVTLLATLPTATGQQCDGTRRQLQLEQQQIVAQEAPLVRRLGEPVQQPKVVDRRSRQFQQVRSQQGTAVTVPYETFQYVSVAQMQFAGGWKAVDTSARPLQLGERFKAGSTCRQGVRRSAQEFGWALDQTFCIGEHPCPVGDCPTVVGHVQVSSGALSSSSSSSSFVTTATVTKLGNTLRDSLWKAATDSSSLLVATGVSYADASPALQHSAYDTRTFQQQGAATFHAVRLGLHSAVNNNCRWGRQVLHLTCENPESHVTLFNVATTTATTSGGDMEATAVNVNVDCTRVEPSKVECLIPPAPTTATTYDEYVTSLLVGCAGPVAYKEFLALQVKKFEVAADDDSSCQDAPPSYHWMTSGYFCPVVNAIDEHSNENGSLLGAMELKRSHSCESEEEVWPTSARQEEGEEPQQQQKRQTFCLHSNACTEDDKNKKDSCDTSLNELELFSHVPCPMTKEETGGDVFAYDLVSMKEQMEEHLQATPPSPPARRS